MELLLILPLLLGFVAFDYFSPGGGGGTSNSGNSTDDAPPDPTPTPSQDDVVLGTGNPDALNGGQGDDFVLGGDNRDTLEGGAGDDIILGEKGRDALYGGIGYDLIAGGAGDDTIKGLKGYDYLIGGSGNDSIQGGEGEDTLVGSSGADTLEGGAGDDLISGLDIKAGLDPLAVNSTATTQVGATLVSALKTYATDTYGSAATPDVLNRLESAFTEPGTSDADDQLFGGRGNDTIMADLSDTITGGDGNDQLMLYSGGANEAIVIKDFVPTDDQINIFVPAGTNPAINLVNGATPADGVSVVIAGDVVAVLKGLVAADVPAGRIKVTVG